MKEEHFNKVIDDQGVRLYTLVNQSGVEAEITNYGGTVISLKAPDRDGRLDDVVLGYDSLDGYLNGQSYFGATIGRYGNRIGDASFTLDGTRHRLSANDGKNHLHGGIKGFHKVVWEAAPVQEKGVAGLELTYRSLDGEEGYPGNLSARVVYTLTNRNELRIDYSATSDQDTIVNMTHHSYFNLACRDDLDVLSHEIMINAGRFTPVGSNMITTGELRGVKGGPFDFTRATPIGARINHSDEQLRFGGGYDHNFVLDGEEGALRQAARVFEPTTGRVMEVWTTEPGLQFYSGNLLDGSITGKGGRVYKRHYGFCLETQRFPDSPNKPKFPSTLLKRGGRYQTTTIYRFSAE